jgi:hypothetical protein
MDVLSLRMITGLVISPRVLATLIIRKRIPGYSAPDGAVELVAADLQHCEN